jgi:hypothetical protein
MGFTVEVPFPGPVSAAYAYLSEPANRPAWQASLWRIEMVTEGPTRVGTQWYDVLPGGVRPLMEITVMQPETVWAEVGKWHGVTALLRLEFEATTAGTVVRAVVDVDAPSWRRPIAWVFGAIGPAGVRNDLQRAARLLTS